MRLLVDAIKGTNLIPKELFAPKEFSSSVKLAVADLKQIQNLDKLYSFLFMDTNSSELRLATYDSQTY